MAGAEILAAGACGGWGRGFYQPKWTCAHYALLELRDLAISQRDPLCTSMTSGSPNRWITLRALRVLRHFESA